MIKSKTALKCWDRQLSDGLVDKNRYFMGEKWCCVGLYIKVRVQLHFHEKIFFESVSFDGQSWAAIIFGLHLGYYTVIKMMSSKNCLIVQ